MLKTFCFTPFPTYATNWNGLNTFGRGTPGDHFCEVWSKSNKWFQRRSRLNEVYTLTLALTDNGQRTVTLSNKRAQRALGCSPGKKVKGHSGAIYRGALMLYTKYEGFSRFLQEDL